MIGIVDCNSFYCACERLFKPDLLHKPVVVLSNNDGCIISRSDEAKAVGIEMGSPYFMQKNDLKKNGVITFSSNYHLYGDLSWRVMETLRTMLPEGCVEVYSVDESFIDLAHIEPNALSSFTVSLKNIIEQWTGISVSIGVAPTKALSKVANRLAKKNKQITGCVLILNTDKKITQALQKTPIADVWGIGYQYAKKLSNYGINTAYDLTLRTENWAHQELGGVVGARLFRELKGFPCIDMQSERVTKHMIATTRMFGNPVTTLHELEEAVATYTARAAEKLRRQHAAARGITVLIVPKQEVKGSYYRHGPTKSGAVRLPLATALTNELVKAALELVRSLFEAGKTYKKAGIILSDIVPETVIQGNLFAQAPDNTKGRALMEAIDNINFSMRGDILKFAASGTTRNWKMRQ
ncbi:MAG: Y-family DNA polymerase, partial [Sediminibacterium sp.]